MQINAGVFNKKIQVIRYEITKDSDGFETKTEITVLNTWAQVTNISGTELLRSNSDFSEVKTRFLIRTPKFVKKMEQIILIILKILRLTAQRAEISLFVRRK